MVDFRGPGNSPENQKVAGTAHRALRGLPPQRNERLTRRFRLAIADIHNGEQVKKLTGQQGPRTAQERIDEVYAIARRAGIEDAALKEGAGFTGIIKTVDQTGPANSVIEAS